MARRKADLFDPVVPFEERHPAFEHIRTDPLCFGGRQMMSEVFATFEDKDGHFIREFQTGGFDARVFELYLHAYFSNSGYAIDATHRRPDFIIERDGVRVAIEATTSGRSAPFAIADLLEPNDEEMARKQRDEMPVRLGSPLFSKLKKQYWKLDHVMGLPFVIAIEAFHDTTALFFPGGILANYLYGLRHTPNFAVDGTLTISAAPIGSHDRPGKEPIPSNFFALVGAEHVSAVLFTNSGTYGKFNRMGIKAGHQRGDVTVLRSGTCCDHDPNAAKPTSFRYSVKQRPTVEPWGEGMEVYPSPNALIPLPRQFFRHAADSILDADNQVSSLVPEFHPYMSHSMCFRDPSVPLVQEVDGITIDLLSELEFNALKPMTEQEAIFLESFAEEAEWLGDRGRFAIASILRHFEDNDWNVVVATRDSLGVFRPVEILCDLPSRDQARAAGNQAIANNVKRGTVAEM